MAEARGVPRLKAPPGTTDTHMHIFDARFPLAPTAVMKPAESPVSEYVTVCRRIGIERAVVVQPSGYGTDNSCTLAAISALGSNARGIAVVPESVPDAELDRLTKAGIRGVRFHMFPGGVLPWESLEPLAARVLPFGWHVQVQLDGRLLPDHEAVLRRLPGTLVIDHVGKFLEPVPVDHPAFRVLVRLVEAGRTYVKLSAPYEVSKVGPPNYDDVGALAKMLVETAPERMLWASNWPHLGQPKERMPDEAVQLDMLLDWAPDESVRHKILVDNPARLYGF
jgi:D-galactarolactone isomerase